MTLEKILLNRKLDNVNIEFRYRDQSFGDNLFGCAEYNDGVLKAMDGNNYLLDEAIEGYYIDTDGTLVVYMEAE